MSTGSGRRVSREDIQLVQNLIERCLQLYMNQKEVVDTLLVQAKIEPGFTELVWKKLEEENQEFFKAYYMRLMVKQQIIEFNKLLEQQVRLMQQMPPTGVPLPASNGTRMPSLHQNSVCYATEHTGGAIKPENIQHHLESTLPNVFINGGSSLHSTLHAAVEMSARANRIDAPSNLINQSSNMGLMQGINGGINGGIIKTEAGFSGGSPYLFGADNNVLGSRPAVADAPIASFSSVESNAQPLNESLLDPDASFGLLGQIPRIFSLSDLTADFSQSSDILESYPRSPFLATDNDSFLDSREKGEQGDGRRLDPVSEGLGYDDFVSE